MIVRSKTDTAARRNNAAWDAFAAIRKIILEETNSQALKSIVDRKYRSIDYTQPAKYPGIDGEKQMGEHAWIDLTIPPQIVADVRKAIRYSDIDQDTKACLYELTSIYIRLRGSRVKDPTELMRYLRQVLINRFGHKANIASY